MRVVVSPLQAEVIADVGIPVSITIANTTTVIGGYTVRVLGADPGWVALEAEQISLFPDESRTITATVTVPAGVPAGARRIAIQVRELTAPHESSVVELELTVPAARAVSVRLDPVTVTAGKRANFSVIVANTGNTTIAGLLAGDDPERKVAFDFEPERLTLAPGEHAVVDLRASARRALTGSPRIRPVAIYLDDRPEDPFFVPPADPDAEAPARDERAALANGTFVQRAVIARGALSLVGLLAAVTVFAIVITFALSRLVGQTTADRNLALQVAAARNSASTSGTSGVAGTVRLLTSGKAVPGVSVAIFTAADTSTPLATTATSSTGAYSITNLAAGQYKISFRGAGFVQLWYPSAADPSSATTITLAAGQQQAGLNATVGGVPATISGTVVGDDVSAATLYLETSTAGGASTATAQSQPAPGSITTGQSTPPDNGNAIVQTVPIGGDGTFTLDNVPSPSVYSLVVTKPGYATTTQLIDVGAGEARTGVQLTLDKGDGLISGTVYSATGALGGVTLTATAGQSSSTTVSLTQNPVGSFTLRSLPTPGTFTLVASAQGYASQILTLTLAAGQKLTGVSITLGQSSGSLTGHVTVLPGGGPAAGVAVTVTNGSLVVQSETQSTGDIGAWTVDGLPIPGTYTVTFARADLASETVSVALDGSGHISVGSQGGTVSADGIDIAMQSATAVVTGTVSQCTVASSTSACHTSTKLGEATVTLASGSTTYTVISATKPNGELGAYRIENVPPGTYTLTAGFGGGTSPHSQVVTVRAGDLLTENITLPVPASISGTLTSLVTQTNPTSGPLAGWTVLLYLSTQYPATVSQTTTTASDGTFHFADVAAGTYIIEVRASPGSSPAASKSVVVQPSQQLAGATAVQIQADPNG